MLQQTALLQQHVTGRTWLTPTDEAAEAERALVEGCRQGDVSAFEDLYRTHGGRMKSMAMNMLGTTQDAEDAVQEAFLKLYRSLPSFRGESRLSTWLYRILVNTCHDMGRLRKRRAELPEPEIEDPDRHPPAPPADGPLSSTLEQSLKMLPDTQARVFLLYEVEGFTHREVGEILSIPEGTSKHALFQAKRGLQAALLARKRAHRGRR